MPQRIVLSAVSVCFFAAKVTSANVPYTIMRQYILLFCLILLSQAISGVLSKNSHEDGYCSMYGVLGPQQRAIVNYTKAVQVQSIRTTVELIANRRNRLPI